MQIWVELLNCFPHGRVGIVDEFLDVVLSFGYFKTHTGIRIILQLIYPIAQLGHTDTVFDVLGIYQSVSV